MQNIEAIIFDIDDTLVQTMGCKWLALKETGKKYYNLKITDSHIKKFYGLPFEKMLLGIFSKIDTYDILKKRYITTSKAFAVKSHNGALSAIKKLKKGHVIGALTSSSRSVILKDLNDAGFDLNDFYFIQTSEDTAFHKPDPRVFDPVFTKLKQFKFIPSNIIYIGDGIRDYQASKNARFHFIAVTTGLTSKEDFINAGVNKKNIISNLLSLSI